MDIEGRTAARVARHGGDEARARELRERLRAGALSPHRLRLAAHLGDRGAMLALDHHETREDDLADRVEALTFRAGKEAIVRVALATARAALRRWEAERDDPGPRLVLETLEAWLTCPCREHADQVHAAAGGVWSGPVLVMGQPVAEHDPPGPVELAARAAATAGRALLASPPHDRAEAITTALYAREAVGARAVWSALREEVLTWALAL
jgi:hypothetical protein